LTQRERSTPTISEVASLAGVGRATVARTLGGYGSVASATRDKVLKAAETLGYRPNSLARSMATQRTNTIGVILADIGNPFFAEVLTGISEAARTQGYDVLLLSTDEDVAKERAAVDVLVNKQVDGMILAPAGGRQADVSHLRVLEQRGIPLVLVDRALDRLEADSVVINNRDAARDAVADFVRRGHRRIGFVWGPITLRPATNVEEMRAIISRSLSSEGDRLLGYLDAIEEAGIEFDTSLVTHVFNDEHQAIRAVNGMLSLQDPPTAILATETDALTGALHALTEHGLSCPEDVSLVGFDDSSWASVMRPPMSVVRQPAEELGQVAAGRLLARLEGDTSAAAEQVLTASFVRRASVSAPPAE
jgi:LacI family transcriptional regulator